VPPVAPLGLAQVKACEILRLRCVGLSKETSVETARTTGRPHEVASNDLKTMKISGHENATLFNCAVQTSMGRFEWRPSA
jgi:hypothetical protein